MGVLPPRAKASIGALLRSILRVTDGNRPKGDSATEGSFKANFLPLLLSLYLPGFLLSLGVGLVAPVVPIYAKSFGVSYALASLVISIVALGRMVMDIPAGIITDKVGRRKPVLLSPLMIAAASVLCGLSGTFWQLIACRFLEGLGLSIWDVSRRTVILDQVPRGMRGRMTSSYLAVTTAGAALGPSVGGVIVTYFSIRVAFFSYSAAALFSFLCVLAFVKESRPKMGGRAPLRDSLKVVSTLGPMKATFVIFMAGFMINFFRNSANSTLFPLFGNIVLHLSIEQIGFALGLAGVLTIFVRFPSGYISDTFGRKKVMVPSQLFGAVTALLMPFTTNYTSVLGVMSLGALVGGLSGGTITAVIGDISPPGSRGAFVGLQTMLIDAAQVSGPIVVGIIGDAYGLRTPYFVMGAVMLVSALTIQFIAKETLTFERDAEGPPPK